MKSATKRLGRSILIAATVGVVLVAPISALAFNGPASGQSAGSGNGAIGVGSNQDISVGTSTTQTATKLLVVASSTGDTSNYAFKVLDSSQNPLLIIRNDGSIGIGTATLGTGLLDVGGTVYSTGNFTGDVGATNVTAGEFGGNTGGGTYSFPGVVSVLSGSQLRFYNTNGSNWAFAEDSAASSVNLGFYVSGNTPDLQILGTNGGSATVMTLTNGLVGIGTTNPSEKLEVNGNTQLDYPSSVGVCPTNTGIELLICGANHGTTDIFEAAISGATNGFTIDTDASNDLTYSWLTGNGAQGLYQSAPGNVGIGTTAPSAKLDVNVGTNEDFDVSGPVANSSGVTLNVANDAYSANVPVEIRASETTLGMVGNVGIGTTNPTSTLQVAGTANITGNLIVGGTFTGGALTGTLSAGNVSSGQFGQNTGGGNYYFPASLGVGITPTVPLEVDDTGNSNNLIALISDSNSWEASFQRVPSTNALSINSYIGGYQDIALANDGGWVGIGTANPGSGLDVENGSITVYAGPGSENYSEGIRILTDTNGYATLALGGSGYSGTSAATWSLHSDPSDNFEIRGDGSEFFDIMHSSGDVGIGTASPSQTLQVNGASVIANDTGINPDSYPDQVVAGAIQPGGGWGLVDAIGGNGGTGHSWAIGDNGDNLYMGYENGSAATTMSTFLWVAPGGAVTVPGTLTAGNFSGLINAGNITPGTFNYNDGNDGTFTFPGDVTFNAAYNGSYYTNGFAAPGVTGLTWHIVEPDGADFLNESYYSSGGGEYPAALQFYSPNSSGARGTATPFIQRTIGSADTLDLYNNGSAFFGGVISAEGGVALGNASPRQALWLGGTGDCNHAIYSDANSPCGYTSPTGTNDSEYVDYYGGLVLQPRISGSPSYFTGAGNLVLGGNVTITGSGSGYVNIGPYGSSNYSAITLDGSAESLTNYSLASGPTDQNLYINRPSGDKVEVLEDNAHPAEFTVAGGGDVGIGTESPDFKLDIANAGNTYEGVGTINMSNLSGTSAQYQGISFSNSADNAILGWIGAYDANNSGYPSQSGGLVFATGPYSTERMRIDNSGNVGIGTAAPNGILDIHNSGDNGDGIVIQPDLDADNETSIQTYIDENYSTWANRTTYASGCCNELALQPDVGYVTIGGTNAGSGDQLTVNGNADITGTLVAGGFSGTINADNVSQGTFGGNTGEGTTYNFADGLSVNSGGNNYIPLYIGGSAYQVSLEFRNGNSPSPIQWCTTSYCSYMAQLSNGNLYLGDDVNGGSSDLTVEQNGYVGIGTVSPSYPLTLNNGSGETGILTTDSGTNIYLSHGGWGMGAGKFGIGNGTLPTLVINADANGGSSVGNVGIGNTSPNATLAIGASAGTVLWNSSGGTSEFAVPQILVSSNNPATDNSDAYIGLDLSNISATYGAYSPVIAFSQYSHSTSYNSVYADIRGVGEAQGGDPNWVAGALTFNTTPAGGYGPVERMRIDDSGDVGIGTASPQSTLTVTNSGSSNVAQLWSPSPGLPGIADADMILGQGSGSYASGNYTLLTLGRTATTNGAGYIQSLIENGGWGNADLSLQPNGGNVGIGTTGPGYTLEVNGDAMIDGWLRTSGQTGWYNQTYGVGWWAQDGTWDRTYNNAGVWTANGLLGSEAGLTVGYGGTGPNTSGGAIIAGYLGVGTASPSQMLEVDGNAKIDGHFKGGGGTPYESSGCGSGGSITGNDTEGTIEVGSGPSSYCLVYFGTAFSATPNCVITPMNAGASYPLGGGPYAHSDTWISAIQPSYFEFNQETTLGTYYVFQYICLGN